MSTTRPDPPGTGRPGTGQPGTGQPGTRELARQVLDRTIALCGIPAPPRHEEQRAEVVRDWWAADGLDAVTVDAGGNVRARLRTGDPQRPVVLLCAHLDTVFGPEVPHAVVRHGGRLSGPGVGDNTVAVCALSALHTLRAAAQAVLDDPAVPLEVSVQAIGERPAGQLDPGHPLATLAAQVLREAGIPPRLTAASTDANAAYPRGIPALTLGITTGEGTHTEQEWIDVDPVAAGLAALAATVARLDGQEW